MSIWKILVTALILFLIGAGLLNLWKEKRDLKKESENLQAELSGLIEGNKKIKDEIKYYEDKENIVKEAKSQFNYRAPDEKLFIIVPETATSAKK